MITGEICVKEFISVSDFLIKSGKVKIYKGYILAPKKVIDKLLLKNQYETIETKLQYWKRLHWIDTDENRYTKQVTMDGKRQRLVKIDIQVFQTLGILFAEILVEK